MSPAREDKTFVYGFRVGHCVEGIVSFAIIEVLGVWKFLRATSTLSEVIGAALAVFSAFLIASMIAWLFVRKQGRKRIVVGASSLRAPAGPRLLAKDLEVPFADVKGMTVTGGKKGALRVDYGDDTLEVPKQMLGSDAQFDELVALMRDRAAK